MAQSNDLDVKVYPAHSEFDPVVALEFEGVNYISFVSSPGGAGEGTYGIPALLADEKVKREGLPARILYVNPHRISTMEVVRKA